MPANRKAESFSEMKFFLKEVAQSKNSQQQTQKLRKKVQKDRQSPPRIWNHNLLIAKNPQHEAKKTPSGVKKSKKNCTIPRHS